MISRMCLAMTMMALVLMPPTRGDEKTPVKVLIITGDHGHNWKETTPYLKKILTGAGMKVDVTETPATDLTADNLAKYDVFLLNYKDTKKGGPDTRWSADNQNAFADAIKGGKGLLVYHHASSAFVGGSDFDKEFEKIIAGGWRRQGNHGKRHVFTVTIRKAGHTITKDVPAEFTHANDELYQNSVMLPGSIVLATAFADKSIDPKNSGKDEPVVWVARYGKGRVCENVLGHDVAAMKSDGFQKLLIRGIEWCAAGGTGAKQGKATSRFDMLKELAGDWIGTARHGPKEHEATVNYKVTASGSTVVETLFGGTEHEMVTMYHRDSDDLVLTHYCMLANQPHMRAAPGGPANTLAFKFAGGSNINPEKDMHMHDMTLEILGDDHLQATWVMYRNGKAAEKAMFDMRRKKK